MQSLGFTGLVSMHHFKIQNPRQQTGSPVRQGPGFPSPGQHCMPWTARGDKRQGQAATDLSVPSVLVKVMGFPQGPSKTRPRLQAQPSCPSIGPPQLPIRKFQAAYHSGWSGSREQRHIKAC